MTCWRRLAEWNAAGVWQRLHELLLAELQAADKLDRSRAAIDSSHVRAARRGPKRPEPGRPRPAVLQAPRPDRGRRHPVGRQPDWRQPQRRHPTAAADRQGPTSAWPTWPVTATAGRVVRRPGLRPRQVPPARSWQRDPASHRPPRPATRFGARPIQVGSRTDDRLVLRHATATHPVGTPRRHPRSIPRPRHLHHYLPTRHPTLLGPLSRTRLPDATDASEPASCSRASVRRLNRSDTATYVDACRPSRAECEACAYRTGSSGSTGARSSDTGAPERSPSVQRIDSGHREDPPRAGGVRPRPSARRGTRTVAPQPDEARGNTSWADD
jgi:hypothetical protein